MNKDTDRLSLGWWLQHPHRNYPWPLPPPAAVNNKNTPVNTWMQHTDSLPMTEQSLQKHACNWLFLTVPGKLCSGAARTCSKEVGCTAAGLWANEEAGRRPEEVESCFRSELPGLSVLSSACASGGRRDFWLMLASLDPEGKEKQRTRVYIRQDQTHDVLQWLHTWFVPTGTGALAIINSL